LLIKLTLKLTTSSGTFFVILSPNQSRLIMLNFIKTRLKTSILLVMFTSGISGLSAVDKIPGNKAIIAISINSNLTDSDPIQLLSNDSAFNSAPLQELANKKIDFQVNSKIVYLNIKHFRNEEAKKAFEQAWQKEQKTKQIMEQTESLRKNYAQVDEDKKDGIAKKILASEQDILDLNNEIPDLYEKARSLENEFWSSTADDQVLQFQEKIRIYSDSLQQITELQQSKNSIIDKNQPDTIDFYPVDEKVVPKPENNNHVVYKILIGAYKGKIPDSASKLIKKLSVIRKIDNSKDEKGMTVYTTGSLKSYQEAVTMQNQVKQEGVKNAQVNAYLNGKKITVDEARKISNEL